MLASAQATSRDATDSALIEVVTSVVADLFRKLEASRPQAPPPVATYTPQGTLVNTWSRTPQPVPTSNRAAPWALTLTGGGVAVTGGILGIAGLAIASGDHTTTNGVDTVHSLTRSQADTANGLATASVILLPVGLLAVTGGLIWLLSSR